MGHVVLSMNPNLNYKVAKGSMYSVGFRVIGTKIPSSQVDADGFWAESPGYRKPDLQDLVVGNLPLAF